MVLSIGSFNNTYRAPTVSEDSKTEQDTHPVLKRFMFGMAVRWG